MDTTALRNQMVETQVRTNDVTNVRLQDALRAVPREAFVPAAKASFAYAELAVDALAGQKLWAARDFAKLAQAADVGIGEDVLVIGGASLYAAAIFAQMGANVTVADPRTPDANALKAAGAVKLAKNGYDKLAKAAYDVVFVDGAVEVVPDDWKKALKNHGRLAVVERARNGVGKANIYTRGDDSFGKRHVFDAAPPALAGFEAEAAFVF